jgi:lipid-binding SYLF domain-containing protein
MVWGQDNGANSTTQSSTTTTTTTTSSNDNDNTQSTTTSEKTEPSDSAADQMHKKAAVKAENAAEAQKDAADNASSKEGEEMHKTMARLDDAAKDVHQLLAAPDDGIPESIYDKAKCVAVVPSMIKGGFIFGAEHGRGVASCRQANGTWSAPAFFEVTGGNWGAQIGAQAVDLTMLIMNRNGMNQLLSSNWKLGGNASASAGPVGRTAAADTNIKFNSEILTYSRSRGLYAGATLDGANIKVDEDAMTAYYGRNVGFRSVLTG